MPLVQHFHTHFLLGALKVDADPVVYMVFSNAESIVFSSVPSQFVVVIFKMAVDGARLRTDNQVCLYLQCPR